jgi:cytochrome c oxidase subunit II
MNWIRDYMLPRQGSELAHTIDDHIMLITAINAFFFALVTGLVLWSVWRYRRKSQHDITPHITHNDKLEVIWTVVPTIIVFALFFIGFRGYMAANIAPDEALEIQVTAKKWVWQFEYPDGMRTLNEVHIPVNKPVKFVIISEDVLHAFYVPEWRVQYAAIPGRYTEAWAKPTVPGPVVLTCTQYCGKGHSDMHAKISVDDEKTYQKWLVEGDESLKTMPLPEIGKLIWENRGCQTCHSVDGSNGQGPTWKGIYGHAAKLANGQSVQVDDNYLRESVVEPQAKVVAGYEPIMPTYQGMLRERELRGVIEYIKTLK